MRSDVNSLFSASDLQALRDSLLLGGKRVMEWRRQRLGLRGTLIFMLSAPLAVAAVVALAAGNLPALGGSAGALALIVFGARLNRQSLLERLVAPRRRFTRATRVPLSSAALVLVALGVGLAAFAAVGHGTLTSLVYAAVAALGFHLAYRLPKAAKAPGFSADRQATLDPARARVLAEAERRLLEIDRAAMQIGNPELAQRLRRIAELGQAVLDLLAQQSTDLYRVRRFLNVHLDGAERVAVRYAKTHRVLRGGVLEANFRNVLVQIETAFERQRQSLLRHEVTDLDIQIEVLRKQLQREGIA